MSCENAEEAAEDAVDHVDSTESAEESEEAASFDFYAIVDFECTCVRHTTERKFKHEIIEFPVVFLNAKTLEVDLEFHRYVRPTEKPELTDFCRELTGIQQAWVDEADTIDVVLRDFYGFLEEHSLFHRPSEGKRCFSFCTDGPMDIQGFLKRETRRKGMCLRACWQTFIDVKRVFGAAFKMKPCGLQEMLASRNLHFQGRPHSGLDDSRNIARLVAELLREGHALPTLPAAKKPKPPPTSPTSPPPPSAPKSKGAKAKKGRGRKVEGGRSATAERMGSDRADRLGDWIDLSTNTSRDPCDPCAARVPPLHTGAPVAGMQQRDLYLEREKKHCGMIGVFGSAEEVRSEPSSEEEPSDDTEEELNRQRAAAFMVGHFHVPKSRLVQLGLPSGAGRASVALAFHGSARAEENGRFVASDG
ncbi:unnamed protein product [Durusdinium trenchii]|uniref:Exonuclease domain-containing protein n=1 Tax=Durusdinium trenchii TaxID=1381693 RepID=A0ABP0JH59_9DINO